MRKLLLPLVLILVLAAGGYYLWISGEEPKPTPIDETAGTQEAAVEISVTVKEYSFTPSKTTVDAGSTVRLTLKNSGNVSHNLMIDDSDVATTLVSPGDSETIDFTVPDEAGTYEFYCSVPGHKEAGMEGTLVVE